MPPARDPDQHTGWRELRHLTFFEAQVFGLVDYAGAHGFPPTR